MFRLCRRRFALLVVGVSALVSGGCNTPTLPPLPPPAEPRVIQHVGDGEVMLEGTLPVEDAKLLVLNLQTNEIRGVFLPDERNYVLLIEAQPGDFMHLWYSLAGQDSPLARFEIPAREEDQNDSDASRSESSSDAGVDAGD
jgi:hypothetical protein